MNQRIKELAKQAKPLGENGQKIRGLNSEYHDQWMEKFALSIVRECAQYMYEHYPHSRYEINYMRKHMGDVDWNKPIKKHFGVEE